MRVDKINVLIKTYDKVNKGREYLYEEVFGFAKEHNLQGCFGRDYFELSGLSDSLVKVLEETKIRFEKIA